jgi:hypothetical protein
VAGSKINLVSATQIYILWSIFGFGILIYKFNLFSIGLAINSN